MLYFKAYATLNNQQIRSLQQLLATCQEQDGISPKIYWEKLSQKRDYNSHFICFDDNRWLGFLSHFIFYANGSDVTGCVHPAFRRQKIFWRLWQMAQQNQHATNRSWQWYFICADELPSGLAFVKSLHAKLTQSEAIYCRTTQEKLHSLSALSSHHHNDDISVRLAAMLDLDAMSQLQMQCFSTDHSAIKAQLTQQLQDPHRKILLLYGQKKLIGKAHLRCHCGLWLHDFCIAPSMRRQGFANILLHHVFRVAHDFNFDRLWLEVDLDNQPAIALYQATQFQLYRHDRYLQVTTTI